MIAATAVNNAREMRFARALVARQQPVDANLLSNKAISLQSLAQEITKPK
ncbi:MAG: oxidoreductase C-terminal domain-containing protein [Stellaceae bacterium]